MVTVLVTDEVVKLTTLPEEEPSVTVVGEQGTTVVTVWTIVVTGTLLGGEGRVMVEGMAETIAGLDGMCAWQRPMKYSTAWETSVSSLAHAERHPETLVTKVASPHQQSGLAVSVHSVLWIQVFKQRGRVSGQVVAGTVTLGTGADDTPVDKIGVLPLGTTVDSAGVPGTVLFPKTGGTTLEVAARVVQSAGIVHSDPLEP